MLFGNIIYPKQSNWKSKNYETRNVEVMPKNRNKRYIFLLN